MPYVATPTTPVGLPAIIDEYNKDLPVSQQLSEADFDFNGVPDFNEDPNYPDDNTRLLAKPYVLSGKYGYVSIFYNRIDLGTKSVTIGYNEVTHVNVSDVIPLINASAGLDLRSVDFIQEPIVVSGGEFTITAKPTSLRYVGQLIVLAGAMTSINPTKLGIPMLVLDNNTLKVYQGLVAITQNTQVETRVTLRDTANSSYIAGQSAWVEQTLAVGAKGLRMVSPFNPYNDTVSPSQYTIWFELRVVGNSTNAFTATAPLQVTASELIDTWIHPSNVNGRPKVYRTGDNKIGLQPGPSNQAACVRFTAPTADTFIISLSCMQDNITDTNHCEVIYNGELMGTVNNDGSFYTANKTMQAGDTLDFVVRGNAPIANGSNLITLSLKRSRDNVIFNPVNYWNTTHGLQVLPFTWCYLNVDNTIGVDLVKA